MRTVPEPDTRTPSPSSGQSIERAARRGLALTQATTPDASDVAAGPEGTRVPRLLGISPPATLPDIQVRAMRLYGLRRQGLIDIQTLERELQYLEAGAALCESCRLRSAVGPISHGFKVCGSCYNEGRAHL